MEVSSAARSAYEELSTHNLRFLEFVERNPACLERAHFAALDEDNGFIPYPLQPWPTFVNRRIVEEMARANLLLCRLIQSIPERVFGYDAERIGEFYGLSPDYVTLLTYLLKDPEYMSGLLSRGDYVNTASGFKCLEVNMGSNLGGWKSPVWAEMYTRVPLFSRFLEEAGVSYTHRDTVEVMFSHVIERARRRRLLNGELNLAFVVPPDNRSGSQVDGFANQELQRILALHGLRVPSQVVVCDYPDLAVRDNLLYARDKRVHVLIEHYDGRVDRQVFRGLLAGTVNVYNGPVTDLMASKRNLALLSELAGSDLFDDDERRALQQYLPWTRTVAAGFTDYQGERTHLPKLLLARQQDLVLKPASSSQGRGVQVGRRTGREAWNETVQKALREENAWIVQEHAESLPYPYQCGDRGCADHDLVWGFFSFGSDYGGGFLRMMPKGDGSGIVNAAQGASEGVIMEVES